jgi:hypothetical protein
MKELLMFFSSGRYKNNSVTLEIYSRNIDFKHNSFLGRIHGIMNELMLYTEICR